MNRLLSSLSLLLLVVAVSHGAELTGREYWKSVLPKTPMPSAITQLRKPDDVSVGVGPGGVGVHVGPGKQNPGGNPMGHWRQNPGKGNLEGGGVSVGVGPGGVGAGVGARCGKRNPGGKPCVSPFDYRYAASETQLQDDPNVALYFLEKQLRPDTKMTLIFAEFGFGAHFIPRSEAEKLPFSSSKFAEILDRFRIAKHSPQAETIKRTLNDCETPGVKGENKDCATSLESMVDFATSNLKTQNIAAFSTNSANLPKQEYTVIRTKMVAGDEVVACHVEPYLYAVFYCHVAKSTRAYMVNLVGRNGDRVDAIAVCHVDTSSWNPKHLAFQVLKIQPGTEPVCHFIPQDHVVWTRVMYKFLITV